MVIKQSTSQGNPRGLFATPVCRCCCPSHSVLPTTSSHRLLAGYLLYCCQIGRKQRISLTTTIYPQRRQSHNRSFCAFQTGFYSDAVQSGRVLNRITVNIYVYIYLCTYIYICAICSQEHNFRRKTNKPGDVSSKPTC